MLRWIVLVVVLMQDCLLLRGQVKQDSRYIQDFELPYVARLSLERTGAGMEISPDNTLVPPSARFPFSTGTNLGLYASYKFINFSVSQALHSETNNKALVLSLNTYSGANSFGGKLGFYNNVASLQDNKNLNVRSSVNIFKFSPYWLINTNASRLSLPAVMDYSQKQRLSAGAFMFELNPFILRARGRDGYIIPVQPRFQQLFNNLAGLKSLTLVNLDFRAGYVYTKTFEEGVYFISGGLFLGPGFGYHSASAEATKENGMHWQSSLRMLGSAGYNGDQFFVAGAFRYTNSFTPVSSSGILADEGSFMLTVGIRFDAFENKLPKTWQGLIMGK